MENETYKLDRSAFAALSFEDADKQMKESAGLQWTEQVDQFNYLMSVAYRFLGEQWPPMDRSYCSKLKRK